MMTEAEKGAAAALASSVRYLNCFQYCSKALQLLGSVMVLLVLGIVGGTWYAVVPLAYGPFLFGGSTVKAIFAALACVVYTAMIVMILWTYFAAVSTDPGRVPAGWHPFADDQMDHYCIWVINCVGLLNYKFFLLFLFYTALGSTSTFFLLLSSLIKFFKGTLAGPSAPLLFIAAVTNFAFSLAVTGFIVMHAQMIAANCTTIEMYEKERLHPWPYQKGVRRNFEEVFGRSKLRWFVPVHTKEERRVMLDSCLDQRFSQAAPFLGGGSQV